MKKVIFSSLCAMLLLVLCQVSQAQEIQSNGTYDFVKMKNPPTYPGGIQKFYEFLGKNIKYPQQAIRDKVQGNVFLTFVVEADGSVTDVKVDRKLGAGTDEEAVRVIKLAKKWNPGKVGGKPVRVAYRLPVKFSMKA